MVKTKLQARDGCLAVLAVLGFAVPARGQLEAGDLLIADAENDRILHVDVSADDVSVVFSQADIAGQNGGMAPGLSGEIHYDDARAYLYFSGDQGTQRLYRGDMAVPGLVALASEADLLNLQDDPPESMVRLTGMATSTSSTVLALDRGDSSGSLYGIDLKTGSRQLKVSEQDFVDLSAGGAGMVDLDFRSLALDPATGNHWILSGGAGQDGVGNARSVLFQADPDGQPLAEFAVSDPDVDWQEVVGRAGGGVYLIEVQPGVPAIQSSVIAIDASGVRAVLLSQVDLNAIFGMGFGIDFDLTPSLAVDPDGLLYLLATNGTVFRVDPAAADVPGSNEEVFNSSDYPAPGFASGGAMGMALVSEAPVGSYTVHESSSPVGLVPTRDVPVQANRFHTLPQIDPVQGDRRFGYWTVNGVRQASAEGRGLYQPIIEVTGETLAVAQYFDADIDGDGDQIKDWWEYWMFGDRDSGPSDDNDGDGINNGQEYRHGFDATLVDTRQAGGVSARMSAPITFNDVDSVKVKLTTFSEPFGLLPLAETFHDSGETITSTYFDFTQLYNGYRFTHWTRDDGATHVDERQAGGNGVAKGRVEFDITEDTELVAHFVADGEDSEDDGVGDGLLDSFELQQLGTLGQGPSDDEENGGLGDGFDNATEQAFGFSPALVDEVASGGVAARNSATVTFALGKSLFTIASRPLGLIPSTQEYVTDDESRTTPYVGPDLIDGMAFAYWEVNGDREPLAGIAPRSIEVTVSGPTEVIAVFFPPDEDLDDPNGDGIPDVVEWHYVGNLDSDRGSNPDGDAFTFGQELDYGYSPNLFEEDSPGGVAGRMAATITFNDLDSGKVKLTTSSDPFALLPLTVSFHNSGETIASTYFDFTQLYSGYRFTHWTRNDGATHVNERVADGNGVARGQAVFDLVADTELVAHFVADGADSDSDGLLDSFELQQIGTLDQGPTDGAGDDGFDNATEQAFGFSPALVDGVMEGGVAARMSPTVFVTLDLPPSGIGLTNDSIEEGQPIGTVVGQFFPIPVALSPPYTYERIAGGTDNDCFAIVGDELQTAESFDFDTQPTLSIRVRVTDADLRSFEQDLVISVLPTLYPTYDLWAAAHFDPIELADPLVSGPFADSDGDGKVNLLERVFGCDPRRGDRSPFHISDFERGGASDPRRIEVTFPWAEGMADASYALQAWTEGSGLWETIPHTLVSSTPSGRVSEVVISAELDPPDPTSELYRLFVDWTPPPP